MDILYKLTKTHLKLNKRRTIVTILGIALSTILMFGVTVVFSSFLKFEINIVTHINGGHHVAIKNMNNQEIERLKNNEEVEKINYLSVIGLNSLNEENDSFIVTKKVNIGYFDNITLEEGNYPSNINEVIVDKSQKLNIGDNFLVKSCKIISDSKEININKISPELNIKLTNCLESEKKVVGIFNHEIEDVERYSFQYKNVYTLDDDYKNYEGNSLTFVYFTSIKNVQDKVDRILSTGHRDYFINNYLLAAHGELSFGNIKNALTKVINIVLTVLLIGCSIVIYNSFAISVMERKKEFGILKSVGATKKQIRKTVYMEAFIVGVIGVIIGIIFTYLIAYLGSFIINLIMKDIFPVKLIVDSNIDFLLMSLIYIFLTILLSTLIPSVIASRFSSIDLIRQSDDIKIKSKKIKSPKFIEKLFGIEGVISYKNIKRNKKKYRISVISLVIAIILFIGVFTYTSGLKKVLDDATNGINAKSTVSVFLENSEESKDMDKKKINFISKAFNDNNLIDPILVSSASFETDSFKDKELYFDEYYNGAFIERLFIYEIDIKNYNKIIKSIGEKEVKPILYNRELYHDFSGGKRKTIDKTKFKKKVNEIVSVDRTIKVTDFYLTSFEFPIDNIFNSQTYSAVLIVPNNYFNNIDYYDKTIYFELDNTEIFKENLANYNETDNIDYTFNDIREIHKFINKFLLLFNIFIYTFILIITLVAVTSIINTIATSMSLRTKEFGILRSIGLTTEGFNKMLILESIFIGMKAIIYSSPFCYLIIMSFDFSVKDVIQGNKFIPWNGIIIAIIMVFVIVLIITTYSTRRLKKANILESLRSDNI